MTTENLDTAGRRATGIALAFAIALIAVAAPGPASAENESYALLVGVTKYPELPARYWLDGPANDVQMFEAILTADRFGFPPENVTTLSGWPSAPAKRPTRENILRAFDDLLGRVEEGDQVVILLAGHGTRQPASGDGGDVERDGRDELFLPADVSGWNGREMAVPNALVDDEIAGWLRDLRKKRAFVWLIADSCHSGTLMRGSPAERTRRIDPADLGIPTAGDTRGGGAGEGEALVIGGLADDPGIVAMYAARADQETQEYAFGPTVYGLFSHHIASVLDTATTPMTYRELMDRIMAAYRSEWRPSPTPVIEGGGADREVLGLSVWPERPDILLRVSDTGGGRSLSVDHGRIHGLTEDSVLSVFPPAGDAGANQALGHVRVTAVHSLTADVVPEEFDSVPAPEPGVLRPECRCQVEVLDHGDQHLRVALQADDQGATSRGGPAGEIVTYAAGTAPPSLERAIAHVEEVSRTQGALLERSDDPADADWFVRAHGDRVFLVPRAGWASGTFDLDDGGIPVPKAYEVGSLADSDGLGPALHDALNRVARATRLLALADDPYARARDDHSGIDAVRVELREAGEDGTLIPAAYDSAGGRAYRPGDKIALYWRNDSRQTVDVNLLFVDADLGITPMFPEGSETCRFAPGEDYSVSLVIQGEPVGPEQIVFVVVKPLPNTPALDLSYLAQPALERSRGSRGGDTPLEKLLRSAMDGTGETRGTPSRELNSYRIRIFSWQTVP